MIVTAILLGVMSLVIAIPIWLVVIAYGRFGILGAVAVIASMIAIPILLAPEKNPALAGNQPLPICRSESKSYSLNQLTDRALKSLIHNYISDECPQYRSIAEFKAANRGCCSFELNQTNFQNEEEERDYQVDELPTDPEHGYLIGRIHMEYYCPSPGSRSRALTATLTACGYLRNTEPH